jgi:uncharacterized protein
MKSREILIFLKQHKKTFHSEFGIVKIGLFGSFARGEATNSSDIDILIVMEDGTEDMFEKRMKLMEYLSGEFNRPVDICHEKAIKPVFRDMVLKDVVYV